MINQDLSKPIKMTDEVMQIAQISITGNVIPMPWYRNITHKSGKPHLPAITILSDIVYWYRPQEIRDEQTGQFVGWKKKFRGRYLQRTLSDFSGTYGLTKKQSFEATKLLESLGVIKKHTQTVKTKMGKLPNVLYIELIPSGLKKITYDVLPVGNEGVCFTGSALPVGNEVLPVGDTNTETTTETTNSITVSENKTIEKPNVDSESATAFPSENTEGHPPQVDLFGETPELSLELQEKQIRAEMRNAYCWMMYGHADLKSLSGKEIKAINSEIARIRKNTRKYSAEHMRRWWADIWGDEWFNKGRTVTTYQQASMSQIRNGMSQAWEAMNNIEIEIIESSSPKPVVMNSQMAEQFLGGEYAS